MVNIQLKRVAVTEKYTQGYLFIGGNYVCDTLEPPLNRRRKCDKLADQPAIRKGSYKVDLEYNESLGTMIPVLAVPGLRRRIIHSGKGLKDLRGGIMVGKNTTTGLIAASDQTYGKLIQKIQEIMQHQRTLYLEIM